MEVTSGREGELQEEEAGTRFSICTLRSTSSLDYRKPPPLKCEGYIREIPRSHRVDRKYGWPNMLCAFLCSPGCPF